MPAKAAWATDNKRATTRLGCRGAALNIYLQQMGVADGQGVHDGNVAIQPRASILEDDDWDARRRPTVYLRTHPYTTR